MTETKYTPGPWQINEHTKERDGSVFADIPDELHSFDNRVCICVAPHLNTAVRWMANARLIAAAPNVCIVRRSEEGKCFLIETVTNDELLEVFLTQPVIWRTEKRKEIDDMFGLYDIDIQWLKIEEPEV